MTENTDAVESCIDSNEQTAGADTEVCPTCGGQITAITTSGPSTHQIAPCGHSVDALFLTRTHTNEDAEINAADQRIRTDGGKDTTSNSFYLRIDGLSPSQLDSVTEHAVKTAANGVLTSLQKADVPVDGVVPIINETADPRLSDSAKRLATDGGMQPYSMWSQLTGFQRDLLEAIADIQDGNGRPYGLAIKDLLEDEYGEEINHGRLYPNLDILVEHGLVEKGELDKRTNHYMLTDAGQTILRQHAGKLAGRLGMHLALSDGGEK